MKKQNLAFTLVELVVVITILGIIWTIAFISLQWYSSKARDSKRVFEIQNIKKSLELFTMNSWKYPLPDNGIQINYDTDLVWTQWIVWENVIKNLSKNLSEVPKDPLSKKEYIYSTNSKSTKYEILSIYESDLISQKPLLKELNAASSNYNKIDWTHNWIFTKTNNYYIPLPSIITSENIGTWMILDANNIKSQIITWWKNKILIWTGQTQTWELNLVFNVFTWTINKDSTDTKKQELANILKIAYSGSSLKNTWMYKKILNTTDSSDLVDLIDSLVLKNIQY